MSKLRIPLFLYIYQFIFYKKILPLSVFDKIILHKAVVLLHPTVILIEMSYSDTSEISIRLLL